MNKVDNLQFYKEMYMYEINRKDTFNSKLSTYIGLLTVMGGIVVFEIENLYQNIKIHPIIQFEAIA